MINPYHYWKLRLNKDGIITNNGLHCNDKLRTRQRHKRESEEWMYSNGDPSAVGLHGVRYGNIQISNAAYHMRYAVQAQRPPKVLLR